jgi:PAS domain-containing protein
MSDGGTTVMTDITEQKLAAQALAAQEAQVFVALDNMPGALGDTNDNLNAVFCNERFREVYAAPARAA